MKTPILTILLIFIAGFVTAASHTVSNNPATLAQFNTIQGAIDASADGDTIYVYGSPNAYASFTILDKKLTIIGPGWSPDKNLPYQAQVQGGFIRNSPGPGTPDGTEIQGLVFTQTLYAVHYTGGGDGFVNNLRIIRCQFSSSLHFGGGTSGLLVEGCVFYNVVSFSATHTYENVLIQNNMFFFSVCCLGNTIIGITNSVNVRFDHNLFHSNTNNGGHSVAIFASCSAISLSNNIFNAANAGSGLTFSTFTNNITNNGGLNPANAVSNATPWLVGNNVDGGGNVSNQSPQMGDQASINTGNSSPLANFKITAGPANNSGSDGKDMGLLYDASGSLNWENSRNSRIPRIFSMNITTPTIPVGGNLNVTVDARKSN